MPNRKPTVTQSLTAPEIRKLVGAAAAVRARAYAPYSGFRVGAAVLSKTGAVHTGCNVENASYGLSLCAERAAVAAAVAAGAKRIEAVAVVSGSPEPAPPCGMCLQTLMELGGPELPVLLASGAGTGRQRRRFVLRELLPHGFDGTFLEQVLPGVLPGPAR